MLSSGSTDLAKGKKFLKKLLYVQHVEKGKDVTSEIPEMYNLNFIAHLKNPTSNLGILKSSLNDEIVEVKIYSNPLEIPIKSDVTIHAFVVFKTVKLWDDKEMWWSLEKNGSYIVLQQSLDEDDVTRKIYDAKKEETKRPEPVKELKSASGNRMVLESLLQVIWNTKQLRRRYNFLTSNCQNFASFIFKELNDEGKKWSTVPSDNN